MGGKVLERAFSVYTGLCLVHVWVESWVVKFWHERSVFTLGGVGYKFGLSLGWLGFGTSAQCLYWVSFGTRLVLAVCGKVFARVFSVYNGLCWVQIWVES